MLYPEIVIIGCGNPLFADDGFGPAVVEELQNFTFPENVTVTDAGTSAPWYIFDMLDPVRTKKLIIIDIVDFSAEPGAITMFQIQNVPPDRIRDAHAGGIIGSLTRIRKDIEVTIIGCQPKSISDLNLEIGLSDEVSRAIPDAIRIVMKVIGMNLKDPTKPIGE